MSDQDTSEPQKEDPVYRFQDTEALKGAAQRMTGGEDFREVSEETRMILDYCGQESNQNIPGIDEAKEDLTYEEALVQLKRHGT